MGPDQPGLPRLCRAFLALAIAPGDVVALDAAAHKVAGVRQAIAAAGT
jgi:hypothetical protein